MDIIKIITRRHLNFNSLLILIKEWSNAFSSRFTTSWFKEKYFKFYHTILCCYLYINFARRLLIRSLVSILHNLFSISRQHISFLARFQTGKKTGFLKKKNSGSSVVCLFLHAASVLFLALLSAPFSYSFSHDGQKHRIHVLYNQGLSRVGVEPQTSDNCIPIVNLMRPISCQSNKV